MASTPSILPPQGQVEVTSVKTPRKSSSPQASATRSKDGPVQGPIIPSQQAVEVSIARNRPKREINSKSVSSEDLPSSVPKKPKMSNNDDIQSLLSELDQIENDSHPLLLEYYLQIEENIAADLELEKIEEMVCLGLNIVIHESI